MPRFKPRKKWPSPASTRLNPAAKSARPILPTDPRACGTPSEGHGAPCPYIFLSSGLIEPGFSQLVGGLRRRDALHARLSEDLLERERNLLDEPLGLGPVISLAATLQPHHNVDDPAGVHHIIRRVENVSLRESPCISRVFQLVVGTARDRPAAQLGNAFPIQHAAERAWTEDIALGLQYLIRLDAPGFKLSTG